MTNQAMLNKLQAIGCGEALQCCDLNVATETFVSAADVKTRVAAFLKQNPLAGGWLHQQMEIVYFKPGTKLKEQTILCGELAAEGTSLHIRQRGAEWLCVQLHESEGDAFIKDQVTHLGFDARVKQLHYDRYWQRDDAWGFRPKYARLNQIDWQGGNHGTN